MRRILMSSAVLSAFGLGAAHAEQMALLNGVSQSEQVTVTATRTAQSVDSVPASVSVITDEAIEENLVNDIKDLIRFEPGVSVQSQPARFSAAGSGTGRASNAGFNIRGLDGNRVLIQVDGVRVPDAYNFSAVTFGRGDYVDMDTLRSVEILRGPASALYGSDGLAGAVSFTTKDPSDLLEGDEDAFAARARIGYSSADESRSAGLTGAGRIGAWSGLLSYTRRDGSETETQGDNETASAARTAANPQEWDSNAVLGRIVFQPSAAHRLRLTADYSDREVSSNILSSVGAVVSGVRTLGTDALDTSERTRVTFDHRYENEGGLIDRAIWNIFYQTSEAYQYTFEDRITIASSAANDRYRASTFINDVWGGALQLESAFETGAVKHRLIYGVDYSETHQEGLRDGAPDTTSDDFPVRPFPITDYILAGAFIQDEISLLDGQLVLYPALRYDSYELNPEDDALYLATPEGQSDSQVTPKFGIVAWPTETFGAYFNYTAGFKAPAAGQVNEYFQNASGNYMVLPNPDLTPETSESVEVGLRWRKLEFAGAAWRAGVTAYAGWYEDFIERAALGGTGAPGNPIRYQYVNLSEVEIAGLEARIDASWNNGISLTISASATDGDYADDGGIPNATSGPLNSVDPLKLVSGLTYADPQGRFGGQFIVTHVGAKEADEIDGAFYPTDNFTLLDITAYWALTDAATVRIGLFNVTDEKYIHWTDVSGLASTSPIVNAYTQPGANFSASLSYRF